MIRLHGLKPYFLALLSAFLLLVAMPGSGGLWFLVFVGLTPLLFAIRNLSRRQVVSCSLLCGLSHYFFQMHWIINVLEQYGGLHISIAIAALVVLAFYMSLYLIFFSLGAQKLLQSESCFNGIWGLPILWVGLDWLRSWLFTGLPWMDLGYALAPIPQLIQLADITGHFGITFIVVLINVLIYHLLVNSIQSIGERDYEFKIVTHALPVCGLIIAVGIYSFMRWSSTREILVAEDGESIEVGIIQGNIDQNLKWDASLQRQTVDKYLLLTKHLFDNHSPEVIVWPETALPFYPTRSGYTDILKAAAEYYNVSIITGAPWFKVIDLDKKEIDYFNSSLLLDPSGAFAGLYFKSHLVPFGEYVPFKKFFPFMEPLVEAAGSFTAGSVENPLVYKNAKAGVLICFESIFPEIGRKWVLKGANYLVNLTNDAWYGKSSAPHHSLAMSVFRAVETRRNLVRSANTGISGIINPLGQMVEKSPLFEPWAAAGTIKLLDGQTFFVRFGYLFGPFCFLISLGLFLRLRKKI